MGELKIPEKEDNSEPLFNKSKVQEYIKSKGLKTSGDLIDSDALNEIVIDMLDRLIAQAKKSGKNEINESDLKFIKEKDLYEDSKFEELVKVLKKHITYEHEKTRMYLTLKTRRIINEMVKNRRVDKIIDMLFKENIPPKKVMKRLSKRIKNRKFDDKNAIEYIKLLEEAVKEYEIINDVFEKTLKEKILSYTGKILRVLLTSGVKGL